MCPPAQTNERKGLTRLAKNNNDFSFVNNQGIVAYSPDTGAMVYAKTEMPIPKASEVAIRKAAEVPLVPLKTSMA
jgi:hypothetical protein